MAYLRFALRNNRFMDYLVGYFKENQEKTQSIDFHFHDLKFTQERDLAFHFTTATNIFMKEVIDNSLSRAV